MNERKWVLILAAIWLVAVVVATSCDCDDDDDEESDDDNDDDFTVDDDNADDDSGDDDTSGYAEEVCQEIFDKFWDCDIIPTDDEDNPLTKQEAIDSCVEVFSEYPEGFVCMRDCAREHEDCFDFLDCYIEECGSEDVLPGENECDPDLCTDAYAGEPTCTDTVTIGGLEWTECDNGADITQYCAICYAADLTMGGHSDWRLPTLDELDALYQDDNEQMTECGGEVYIRDPFDLSCTWEWSSDINAWGSAWGYEFDHGTTDTWGREDDPAHMRALAVRP